MKRLKISGYFIFIVSSIIFSLYIHFPGKNAAKYIEQQFIKIHPDIKIFIDDVQLLFPPGIRARSVLMNYAGISAADLHLGRVDSYLKLTTILKNQWELSFNHKVFNGNIFVNAKIDRTNPKNIFLKTQFRNLDLHNHQFKLFLHDCKISGIINGQMTTNFKQGNLIENKAAMQFTDMVFHISNALLPVNEYSFSNGEFQFFIPKNNTINIEKCILKGRQADLDLSGQVHVAEQFEKSILDINVRLILYPIFFMNTKDFFPSDVSKNSSEDNTIVNIHIRGTIQTPEIIMDQVAG